MFPCSWQDSLRIRRCQGHGCGWRRSQRESLTWLLVELARKLGVLPCPFKLDHQSRNIRHCQELSITFKCRRGWWYLESSKSCRETVDKHDHFPSEYRIQVLVVEYRFLRARYCLLRVVPWPFSARFLCALSQMSIMLS